MKGDMKNKNHIKLSEEELNYTKMVGTAVSLAFGVSDKDVLGLCRAERIAVARHTAYWVLRNTGMSFPRVAKALKRNCHGSSMNGYKAVEDMLSLNAEGGYASSVREASNHYTGFLERFNKARTERKIKELENALR